MKLSLIAARADNGVIGKDGGIPWRVSSDMKLFRRLTMGKPVVMGRKTWDSLKKPLEGRDNIVVTRRRDAQYEGAYVAESLDKALSLARECAVQRGVDEVMVMGGAQIYRTLLSQADRVYLTEIHLSVEGDTVFPELDPDTWRESSRVRHRAGPKDEADYSLVILDKRKDKTHLNH